MIHKPIDKEKLSLIEARARSQAIDLNEARNAYTLWSFPHGMYCGSCDDFNAAIALSRKHVNLKEVYIVNSETRPHRIAYVKEATPNRRS